ncbi:hypothetical protein OSB04_029012 [Centaurea solstitialis]|uniref:Uncharacterized protein n=1 Tax=Centaurea solstitialis TaxID=347529 RepID=A0AA38SV89_9ASTR|nr:hypothetical protein OSB04_029012 [Centaurea solstitialis]
MASNFNHFKPKDTTPNGSVSLDPSRCFNHMSPYPASFITKQPSQHPTVCIADLTCNNRNTKCVFWERNLEHFITKVEKTVTEAVFGSAHVFRIGDHKFRIGNHVFRIGKLCFSGSEFGKEKIEQQEARKRIFWVSGHYITPNPVLFSGNFSTDTVQLPMYCMYQD